MSFAFSYGYIDWMKYLSDHTFFIRTKHPNQVLIFTTRSLSDL